jgi:hypothetical protein
LQVFALEKKPRAGLRVDGARGGDRRLVSDAGDLRRRAFDVSEGRKNGRSW